MYYYFCRLFRGCRAIQYHPLTKCNAFNFIFSRRLPSPSRRKTKKKKIKREKAKKQTFNICMDNFCDIFFILWVVVLAQANSWLYADFQIAQRREHWRGKNKFLLLFCSHGVDVWCFVWLFRYCLFRECVSKLWTECKREKRFQSRKTIVSYSNFVYPILIYFHLCMGLIRVAENSEGMRAQCAVQLTSSFFFAIFHSPSEARAPSRSPSNVECRKQ